MNQVRTTWVACLLAIAAVTATAPAQVSSENSSGAEPLKQYADATRALYDRVSQSVVRVRVDQSPESLIPPQMRKDFPQWKENFLKRGMAPGNENNPTVIRIEPKPRGPGGPPMPALEAMPTPAPVPGGPGEENRNLERRVRPEMGAGDNYALVKRFLEIRLPRIQDPELLNKVRQGIIRAEALHGEHNPELAGVVLDDQGHVLLMMTLLRDSSDVPIKVTTADGREFGATFVGADYLRGFSILKMAAGSTLPPPVEQARTRPQSGELLMCLSANTGAVGWITAPGANMAPRRGDDRFAVFGEDHGPIFLFSIDGKLSAVGLDHYALPIAVIKKEIQEVKTKGFVSRRQFGVRHTIVGIDSPLRKIPALSHKPAIRVEEVFKNSLAERAGLKKDDIILTIDDRPITQLPRILQDLSARSGEAKIGIIRDEKEMELTLPLDKPAEKSPERPVEKSNKRD